jgi:hypothetical protein
VLRALRIAFAHRFFMRRGTFAALLRLRLALRGRGIGGRSGFGAARRGPARGPRR